MNFAAMNFFAPQRPVGSGMQFRIPDSTTSQVDNQDDGSYGSADVYQKLLGGPPPPAQARYRDFLDNNAPTRDQYKPSKLTRVGSILSGISEGVRHGAGSANAVQQSILDSGYNDAVSDYKMQADRLKGSADLEEKDILNRVKTYRDVLGDQANIRNNERAAKLDNKRIENYDSQIANRGRDPMHFSSDVNGNAIGVRPDRNAPGGFSKLDFGFKTGQSPSERENTAVDQAGRISNIRLPNELAIARERGNQARQTQAAKFNSIKELVTFKNNNPNYTFKTTEDGDIVGINPKDPTDVVATGYNSGKLSDTDKMALGLKNAKELKAAPRPGTTSVTTLDESGKKVTKVTTPNSVAPKTVHVILTGGRELDLPEDKLAEAKQRDPGLKVIR